jgi:trimeric autotransporter adhesin
MSMYENGVHKFSKANTNTIGHTDHITRVGTGVIWNNSPHSGSLALVRVSATAPTAEQIAKMYNDEKHLFQTNAKATLYGSYSAVTALAYDDDTELLHAGTSAGRSVFQGLNRVDNTTDAVDGAISASNGFIVED